MTRKEKVMVFNIENHFGEPREVKPRVGLYQVKDLMGKEMPGLAIMMVDTTTSEGVVVVTKSFGEMIGMKDCAYIDINNCPFATRFLDEGYAEDTGLYKNSGFCKYPLWHFKEDFLNEIGGNDYKKYSEAMKKYFDINIDEGEDLSMGGM